MEFKYRTIEYGIFWRLFPNPKYLTYMYFYFFSFIDHPKRCSFRRLVAKILIFVIVSPLRRTSAVSLTYFLSKERKTKVSFGGDFACTATSVYTCIVLTRGKRTNEITFHRVDRFYRLCSQNEVRPDD